MIKTITVILVIFSCTPCHARGAGYASLSSHCSSVDFSSRGGHYGMGHGFYRGYFRGGDSVPSGEYWKSSNVEQAPEKQFKDIRPPVGFCKVKEQDGSYGFYQCDNPKEWNK